VSRVIADNPSEPSDERGEQRDNNDDEAERTEISRYSGMWKMWKSQEQRDSNNQPDRATPDDYADFCIAYATVPGMLVTDVHRISNNLFMTLMNL